MSNRQTVALILFLGGLAVLILSLAADVIGIGREAATFGWAQIVGSLVGVGIAVVGGWLYLRR
jgi:hypothetical protein